MVSRAVAVLEHTDADGNAMRVAAVSAHGEDVGKLADIDWGQLGRIQNIATREADLALDRWAPTVGQRANIEGLLAVGDTGQAMGMYWMNVGAAQHAAMAQALQREGFTLYDTTAGQGVDFPIETITASGIPLPIELHPDFTFSFERHIMRDYPSYLTINTPKIAFGRFHDVFGSGR